MVSLSECSFSGLEYLAQVTKLLQRVRLAHPSFGVWEAADLQWWWRKPRKTDEGPQHFWYDTEGHPVAAAIATNWGGRLGLDLITMPELGPDLITQIWRRASDSIVNTAGTPVEVMVADDTLMVSLLRDADFKALTEKGTSAWMRAEERPPVSEIADGYELVSRVDLSNRPHHFVARNGPGVEARLRPVHRCRLHADNVDNDLREAMITSSRCMRSDTRAAPPHSQAAAPGGTT